MDQFSSDIITPYLILKCRKRWYRFPVDFEDDEDTSHFLEVIEGYQVKHKIAKPLEVKRSPLQKIVDLCQEMIYLYRQIGLKQWIKFFIYKTKPRTIYVDAVKVNMPGKGNKILLSHYGIPLQTHLTKIQAEKYELFSGELQAIKKIDPQKIKKQSNLLKLNQKKNNNLSNKRWLVAGTGNYVTSILIPSILSNKGFIEAFCANTVSNAAISAEHYGAVKAYDDFSKMLKSYPKNYLLIATPHYLHPTQLVNAIQKKYPIYCEKPVAIDRKGIELLKPYAQYSRCMVGFNRRFSPAIQFLLKKKIIGDDTKLLSVNYLVNFGSGYNRNMMDKKIGGGTIHGAVCHYIDLIEFIANSRIKTFNIVGMEIDPLQNFTCNCKFDNGGVASLTFSSLAPRSYDIKEKIIIRGANFVVIINDFSELFINGKKRKRYFYDHFGAKSAINYFQENAEKSIQYPAPTLMDGIRVTELTLSMEEALTLQQEDRINAS